MGQLLRFASISFCISICAVPALAEKFSLPQSCEIPWKEIAVEREVSDKCGVTGAAEVGPGAEQNRMKNNLCASNTPVSLAYKDFSAMQRNAEKKTEKEVKEAHYYRSERTYGSFYRRMTIPFEVKPEQIEAEYKDGVLQIRIPKPIEAKTEPHRIEIG